MSEQPPNCEQCGSRMRERKSSDRMTSQEFDDCLDLLANNARRLLDVMFEDRLEFIIVVGKGDYRGTVTSLSLEQVPAALRRAVALIESGQQEWKPPVT